ncbi:hypothetical protein RvY_06754 [Ramazzottius varieornatus]|uniref:Uncharacterized protein n=1 Tax=Ramazzottius varieornatus TaxID=947166 RepID=A0A1D1UZQ3_RAMVA|nr:hypothetical protein RvY_06754 [Ramazzottius varieornatus]
MKPKNGNEPGKGSQVKFNPKLKKEMQNAKETRNHNRVLQDDRFSRIATDPRFRGLPAEEKKIQIDDRFESMFTDKRFNQKHTVDKRGRPVNFASSDSIQKFYELSDKSGKKKASQSANDRFKLPDGDGTDEDTSDEEEDDNNNAGRDFSRGKGNVESSSSEESTDEDEDGPISKGEEIEEIEHPWAELANDAPSTDEVTNRLALVNMDWENIRPEDIFALLNSFKPTNGSIESITIYPSEYGKAKMAEEGTKGPLEYEAPKNGEEEEEDDLDADLDSEEYRKKATEKLRKYQLNRLKYYYAVVVCDSKETANKVYEECDGLEYENSSTVVDLRFVPDEMEFDDSEAKSTVKNLPANYQPAEFVSTALQQSKVRCSWDETARDRQGLGKLVDWAKMDDIQAYLASSSSEQDAGDVDDVDNDTRSVRSTKDPEAIERYRALILERDSKDKSKKKDTLSDESDVDLEVDWEPGVKTSTEIALNEQKKRAEVSQLTPFEKILEKQKLRRKNKKLEKSEKKSIKVARMEDEEEESDDDLEGSSEDEEEEEEEEDEEDDSEEEEGEHEAEKEKADLELLVQDDKDSKRHFSLKKLMRDGGEVSKTKKKQLRKKRKAGEAAEEPEDGFQMDLKDERFEALFTSNQYNVDMSDPAFKKTKAMDALIKEKLQRVKNGERGGEKKKGTMVVRPEISLLAESVQAKTRSSKK